MAALALSAVAAMPASALAAAPKNTALPVVSPTTPHLGIAETTTNGSWTESPTSYSYSWRRCNAGGGECVSISGATKSTYTPVEADIGHSLVAQVTATNASGSTPASSKATSALVIAPAYWYSCKNVGAGAGLFEDAACSKEGGTKAFAWSKLTASSSFSTSAAKPFTLTFNAVGPFLITCSTQTATGALENPSGGDTATLTPKSFVLSGCVVDQKKQPGCVVKGGAIVMPNLRGKATEFETKPAIRFAPSEGSIIFVLTLEGCKYSPNTNYNFAGSFTGVVNNATSSLEFASPPSALILGTSAVQLQGTSNLQLASGEAWKLAP